MAIVVSGMSEKPDGDNPQSPAVEVASVSDQPRNVIVLTVVGRHRMAAHRDGHPMRDLADLGRGSRGSSGRHRRAPRTVVELVSETLGERSRVVAVVIILVVVFTGVVALLATPGDPLPHLLDGMAHVLSVARGTDGAC